MNIKIIAVDCDGTLFENKWPGLGAPNMKLIEHLKKQRANGDTKVVLWTCRDGEKVLDVIYACNALGLQFDAVNDNVPEVMEEFGANTRKIFAHEYIDDRSAKDWDLPFVAPVKKPTFTEYVQYVCDIDLLQYQKDMLDEVNTMREQHAIVTKLEQVFGFKLHSWQIKYLFGGDYYIFTAPRGSGKTFIRCIKALIIEGPTFDLFDLKQVKLLVDIPNPSPTYVRWLQGYMLELNYSLVAAGFETNHWKGFKQ